MTDPRQGGIAVLDFGSQYTQLIARRVREQGVYAEVFPNDASPEKVNVHHPRGYILSGGPSSVYEPGAPQLPAWMISKVTTPILGICYGMQALTHALGGTVAPSQAHEYGPARIVRSAENPLLTSLPDTLDVWMSHGDRIERPPTGFVGLAASGNAPYAAMGNVERGLYGLQFHPEVAHTPRGVDILRNFIFGVCGCQPNWSSSAFIEDAIQAIRACWATTAGGG
jgi:GMP synthase (glutamine-hydrolysing)